MNKLLIFHHSGKFTLILKKVDWEHSKPEYMYGLAVCHPKDQFSRKIGRTIARGRISKADRHFASVKETLVDVTAKIDRVNNIRKGNFINRQLPLLFVHVEEVAEKIWK